MLWVYLLWGNTIRWCPLLCDVNLCFSAKAYAVALALEDSGAEQTNSFFGLVALPRSFGFLFAGEGWLSFF